MRKIVEVIHKKVCKGYYDASGDYHRQPGHPCTFTRYDDGSISYDAPNLHRHHPRFRMTNWKPRVETAEKTFSRLLSETHSPRPYEEKHVGFCHGGKWVLRATDGYKALFSRGSGPPSSSDLTETSWPKVHSVILGDPEIHLAVRRALVMSPERPALVSLSVRDDVLTVASECDAGDFEETLPLLGEELDVCINGKFLESALGAWPLKLMYPVAADPQLVVFAPPDDSWRYAVATMRP